MSPEQATGHQHVGPQADIYAMGCVLYEMLAGEPPYPGKTAQAVLGKIIAASQETLRQGFELMVRRVAPDVVDIADTTDHASGTTPFYRQTDA